VISFIVIGRNEGRKLTVCLSGIKKTIEFNNLKDYEIIYVDSGSTDDSIRRAGAFHEVKRMLITGDYNAAVARNIGAKEAKGDILFFIDGDVEISPPFLNSIIRAGSILKYNCVTGHIVNIYYDMAGNLLGNGPATYKGEVPSVEKIVKTCGGNFVIKKSGWELNGGMKTKYKKNQDLDFTLRLNRKGIKIIRIPEIMALHHTVDYRNNERMWKTISSRAVMYPAVLLRDHIFNKDKILHSVRRQYTSLLLLLSASTFPFNLKIAGGIFLVYLLIAGLKTFNTTLNVQLNRRKKTGFFFERFAFQIIHDFVFWGGFFFFYPSSIQPEYKQLA
jgi:glycosyltransferase involved in cell wall biosynthesis